MQDKCRTNAGKMKEKCSKNAEEMQDKCRISPGTFAAAAVAGGKYMKITEHACELAKIMETARKYRALDGGPEKFTTVRCSVPVRNVFVHASHADQRCARKRRVCRYNVAFVCTLFLHMGEKRRFCVHRGKTQLLRALFFGELRISRGNAAFACTGIWRIACTDPPVLVCMPHVCRL